MRTNIIQIGNSKGVRIPKTLLEQLKFDESVEFEVLPEGLLLRPVHEKAEFAPREGWGEMFRSAFAEGGADDRDEFADWDRVGLSEFDEKEW